MVSIASNQSHGVEMDSFKYEHVIFIERNETKKSTLDVFGVVLSKV